MKRLASILPLLLLSVASAEAPEELLDPAPITKEAISLNLPKTWKEQPREVPHTLLIASPASPDTDTTGDYLPVLIIRATPRSSTTGNVINGDAQQTRVASEMSNYQITEKPQQLSINGLDVTTFGGTFTQGALKLRSRQYFILANDQLYSLTLITLASAWDARIPALDASVHSFAIPTKK